MNTEMQECKNSYPLPFRPSELFLPLFFSGVMNERIIKLVCLDWSIMDKTIGLSINLTATIKFITN